MTRRERADLFIFDLDGTLVDSARDICNAIRLAVAAYNPPVAEQAARECIATGLPLSDIFARLAPGCSPAPMIARYREIYAESCADTTVPFPGVVPTLDRLGPARCVVATTKRTPLARTMVSKLGLAGRFALVQGTDDFPHKPSPVIAERILAHFGIAPDGAVMVGDTLPDLLCARAAGVSCGAALYGNGDPEQLRAVPPDFTLSRFDELLNYFD